MIGCVESFLLDVNTSLLADLLVQQALPLLPASSFYGKSLFIWKARFCLLGTLRMPTREQ